MITFTARIYTDRSNEQKILEIFSHMKGPIAAKTGCMSTHIYREHADGSSIVYQEAWQDRELLLQHICSSLFRNILMAVDMSSKPPEILFDTISKTEGMELIEKTIA